MPKVLIMEVEDVVEVVVRNTSRNNGDSQRIQNKNRNVWARIVSAEMFLPKGQLTEHG